MAPTTASRSSVDPTASIFTNTIFSSEPVPPDAPLPRLPPPAEVEPGSRAPWFCSPPPQLFFMPDPPISFIHRRPGAPYQSLVWDGAKAIADGDTFHTKYQWSTEAKCMAGRLMLGIAAQGPPGSGHGGSIAAVLDDLIGVTGVMCALQLHLQGVFQSQEPFAGKVAPDAHKYISMALDVYYEKTAEEKAQFRLHPDLTFEQLERNRDKLLPYSAAEAAFIFAALAEGLRQMPDIPGSSFPPTGLVGEITCRLKKRVPLLTRLAVRARMTKLEGKRVHVIAEIYGKKTTRVTALDPDDSGGWEGDFDVLLAEGKGTLTVMYGTNLKGASQGAKI